MINCLKVLDAFRASRKICSYIAHNVTGKFCRFKSSGDFFTVVDIIAFFRVARNLVLLGSVERVFVFEVRT